MYRKKFFLFSCLLFFFINSFAQSDSLPVKLSLEKSDSGDSLWFTVSINRYTKPGSLMFTASLENNAAKDTFFLPVIDSVSQYCFVYPLAIQQNLSLQAYFFPGIFKVSGMLNDHKRSSPIKAILITDNEKIYNKEITLQANNRFTLPPLVFEKQASLAFNYADDNKWKNHPDIAISISPAATDFTQLVFSTEIKRVDVQNSGQAGKKNTTSDSLENVVKADSTYKILKGVQVAAAKKSNIEKFNEAYSSGLFKDGSEKVIDCLDNNGILSYPNCLNYLQTLIPGLSISTDQSGDMVVNWRGREMKAFYIDEIAVDIEQVLGINTAEIAMLKVYPPPFFGSAKGDGGAIALYTSRGEFSRPDTTGIHWLFTIKGYSAAVNILFEKN
jgi:hypothetical protein